MSRGGEPSLRLGHCPAIQPVWNTAPQMALIFDPVRRA
jgi:hypothetical protein